MKKLPLSKIVEKAQPLIELYNRRKQIVAKLIVTNRDVAPDEQDCWWNLTVELPIYLTLSAVGVPGAQLRVLSVSAAILKYSYS